MSIITITNMKGGTGKTSTCSHVAQQWASRKLKVLLIDADPQCSLTRGLWGPERTASLAEWQTVYQLFAGDPPAEQVVHETPFEGLWIVPGHRRLDRYNKSREDSEALWDELEGSIRRAVDDLRVDFDRIVIDTPPNLYLCTHAALMASDWTLVPVQPEDYGAQGTSDVTDAIDRVQRVRGGLPALLGYFQMMTQRGKSVHSLFDENLRAFFGDALFDAVVPDANDFPKALAFRKSLGQVNKRGAAYKAIKALVDEIDRRSGRGAA